MFPRIEIRVQKRKTTPTPAMSPPFVCSNRELEKIRILLTSLYLPTPSLGKLEDLILDNFFKAEPFRDPENQTDHRDDGKQGVVG